MYLRKILSAVLLLIVTISFAQETIWELTWKHDSLDIYPQGINLLNDSTIVTFLKAENDDTNVYYPPSFITFNTNGIVQDSLLPFNTEGNDFRRMHKLKNKTFFTSSVFSDTSGIKYFEFTKFDNQLNTLWQTKWNLPNQIDYGWGRTYVTEDNNCNIYFYSQLAINNGKCNDYYCKLSAEGDSLTSGFIFPQNFNFFGSEGIANLNDSTILVLSTRRIENPQLLQGHLLEYNLDFELRNQIDISNIGLPMSYFSKDMLILSDNTLLIFAIQPSEDKIAMLKLSYNVDEWTVLNLKTYDFDFNSLSISIFYRYIIKSLDDCFYIVCKGYEGSFLIKFDQELNELWRKKKSYDNSYNYPLATPDGGLLFSRLELVNINGENRIGTHFEKIGANGEQLSVSKTPAMFKHSVYPNPGREWLHLSVLQDMDEVSFALYNLSGQLVKKQIFSGMETQMEISELPQGFYFYKVQKGNQLFCSGRWIRE